MGITQTPSQLIRRMTPTDQAQFTGPVIEINFWSRSVKVNLAGSSGPRWATVPITVPIGTAQNPLISVGYLALVERWPDNRYYVRDFIAAPTQSIGTPGARSNLHAPQWVMLKVNGSDLIGQWTPVAGAVESEVWVNSVAGPQGATLLITTSNSQFASPVGGGNNGNLIAINPGFESGNFTGWTPPMVRNYLGISTVTTNNPYQGSYSARFQAMAQQSIAEDYYLNSPLYPCVAGGLYLFGGAWRFNSTDVQHGSGGIINVIWYNSTKGVISTSIVGGVGAVFDSSILNTWRSTTDPIYSPVTFQVTAPAGAAFAELQLDFHVAADPAYPLVEIQVDNLSLTGPIPLAAQSFYAVRAMDALGNVSPFSEWLTPTQAAKQMATGTIAHQSASISATMGMQIADAGVMTTGWEYDGSLWKYVAANQFKILPTVTVPSGDWTGRYTKGTKIRWMDGGAYKYGYILSATFASGATTVTFTGGSDYAMANATITNNYISYANLPQGFPDVFNWTPTITGFSTPPANGLYRFRVTGHTCIAWVQQANQGTSNAIGFTISAPITAASIPNVFTWSGLMQFMNNGVTSGSPGIGNIGGMNPSSVFTFYTNLNGGGWSAANAKGVYSFTIVYEI